MDKINREQAEREITGWLDKKKITDRLREENKDNVSLLIDAVCDGQLIVNADTKDGDVAYGLTQKLLFPLGEEKELTYLLRINYKHLNQYMQGVKGDNFLGMITAYVCALTRQNRNVVDSLDTTDRRVANAIAVFFM